MKKKNESPKTQYNNRGFESQKPLYTQIPFEVANISNKLMTVQA